MAINPVPSDVHRPHQSIGELLSESGLLTEHDVKRVLAHQRKRGLRFVDPRAAFASHGVCSRDRWIYPYAKEEDNWNASFHPNLAGQRALAFLIAARNRDLFR